MSKLSEAYEREILGYPDDSDWDAPDFDEEPIDLRVRKIRDNDFSFVDPLSGQKRVLDEHQIAIIKDLERQIDDDNLPRGTIKTLSAPGGHGKSALLSVLLRRTPETFASATTNKAVSILRSYGREMETCHRLFMCPIKVNQGDKQITLFLNFQEMEELCEKRDRRLPRSWHSKKARLGNAPEFLVVDEASQLNTQLWEAILAANFKVVLLIGDVNQCPPINDYKHPAGVFNTLLTGYTLQRNYRLEAFEKSADEAQKSHYREVVKTLQALRHPQFCKALDIVTVKNWLDFLNPLLPRPDQTVSSLFNDGYQFITYTNDTRRNINYLCRLAFFRNEYDPSLESCEELELHRGETIMLKSNSVEDRRLYNGKLFDVEGSQLLDDQLQVSYQIGDTDPATMLVNARYLNWDMSGFTKALGKNQVPNSLPEDWLNQCRAVSFTGNSDGGDSTKSTSDEALQEMLELADDLEIISEPSNDGDEIMKIVLGYCLTIHNSQGSEFDKVCVVIPPSLMNAKDASRRLLYTAFSRTKSKLVIVPESWNGLKNFMR